MTGVGLLSADTVTRIAADRAPFPFQTNCLDDDLSLPAHYDDFKKKNFLQNTKRHVLDKTYSTSFSLLIVRNLGLLLFLDQGN